MLFIDLDGFKQINDTYGHAIGDDVLIAAAERIRRALRPSDTVARLGGDEFSVVLREVEKTAALQVVARNILAALRMRLVVEGHAFEITASIGAVAGSGTDTYDSLVKRADVAMYDAKRAGRNTYVVAGEGDAPPSCVPALPVADGLVRASTF